MTDRITTKRGQLKHAIGETGEDESTVVVLFQNSIGQWCSWNSETPPPIIKTTVEGLPDREFDDGYGAVEGEPMIAFGPNYVYISVQYDGSEHVEAIPRNPDIVTNPIPWPGG